MLPTTRTCFLTPHLIHSSSAVLAQSVRLSTTACCQASLSAPASSGSVADVWYCFGLPSLISWLLSGLAQKRVAVLFFFFLLCAILLLIGKSTHSFGHVLFFLTCLIINYVFFPVSLAGRTSGSLINSPDAYDHTNINIYWLVGS